MQKISNSEFFEKYKDVKVKFKEYFKMRFTFDGTIADGKRIEVTAGQNSWDGDPYKFMVRSNEWNPIEELEIQEGFVYDGEECIEYCDWTDEV